VPRYSHIYDPRERRIVAAADAFVRRNYGSEPVARQTATYMEYPYPKTNERRAAQYFSASNPNYASTPEGHTVFLHAIGPGVLHDPHSRHAEFHGFGTSRLRVVDLLTEGRAA
jgi:hypothetical protein